MTYATALTNLDIDLSDSDNFTFTPEEKERALTEAWNDPFNVSVVWDETITYDSSVYRYAIPATMTSLKDVWYKYDATEFPEKLDSYVWESINGYIHINPEFRYLLSDGANICLRGNKQLTITDACADNRAEYLLKVARYNLLGRLGGKKTNKFLQNDTSMAEIVAMRQQLEKDIAQARRRFTQAPERI